MPGPASGFHKIKWKAAVSLSTRRTELPPPPPAANDAWTQCVFAMPTGATSAAQHPNVRWAPTAPSQHQPLIGSQPCVPADMVAVVHSASQVRLAQLRRATAAAAARVARTQAVISARQCELARKQADRAGAAAQLAEAASVVMSLACDSSGETVTTASDDSASESEPEGRAAAPTQEPAGLKAPAGLPVQPAAMLPR